MEAEPQKKNGLTLAEYYKDLFPKLLEYSSVDRVITEHNVFQTPNYKIRELVNGMCREVLLPGSGIKNFANAEAFLQQLKEGKKGLILMEHYSNFDLPILIYMLSSTCGETGRELSERIVAIAGMKLNEDNPYIAAFAEAYARIVIYPSRSLAAVADPEEHKKEEQRSRLINIASMRAFERVRQEGNAVLVFPSGTRYRPGHPETKRGVREIDSYIKLSDVVMPVSINGNCLRIPESKHEMTEDVVFHDRLIMTAGNICSAAALREEAKQWAAQAEPDQTDRKQITVDYVMHILENMHTENEKGRLDGLEETPGTAG
ncbi:MAG: 1-acyl-sn-glycerol-3-phosphate acyltransferase [Spirochaetes bacterium]|uniref:1-acyl-sn-glycerol-3-phosphate acyltransferase n=1 Tax=Candidatus Avitreponema avistercoris TaxID=2840705 RepID=A0A9D9EP62_9SPIR|nr:1-acyl-sn-glycerol-3-phosphate acyltransferase [Candidatus Avitreponema avistercoris]